MADSWCNPLGVPRHNWSSRKISLRPVSKWMCNNAYISMGSKICDMCQKKLAKQPDLDPLVESVDSSAISGLVTCAIDGQWWLGYWWTVVPSLIFLLMRARHWLCFLHPSGPSHSYKNTQKEHAITLNLKYVWTTVDPRSRSGRVYTLLKKDIKLATEKFARMYRKWRKDSASKDLS